MKLLAPHNHCKRGSFQSVAKSFFHLHLRGTIFIEAPLLDQFSLDKVHILNQDQVVISHAKSLHAHWTHWVFHDTPNNWYVDAPFARQFASCCEYFDGFCHVFTGFLPTFSERRLDDPSILGLFNVLFPNNFSQARWISFFQLSFPLPGPL